MQTADINMISLVTSIFSIALAILAIALSLFFYKWTSALENSIKENVRNLGQEIEGMIEFNKTFYGDTFTLVKEAYGDMRKHAWPETKGKSEASEREIEERVEQALGPIKENYDKQLGELIDRQKMSDERAEELTAQIGGITDNLLLKSTELEKKIRSTKLREDIYSLIKKGEFFHIGYLFKEMEKKGYSFQDIEMELGKMTTEGILGRGGSKGEWAIKKN